MSEITVHRVTGHVIMTLIGDDKRKVEISLDEAEAATLGSLLLNVSAEAPAGFPSDAVAERNSIRNMLKPRN